jgi:twitching motility protein PilT
MRDGKLDGMQEFDSVIRELIEKRVVTLEDGLAFATNQNNLLLSLKGLTAAEDFLRTEINKVPGNILSESGSMLGMIE